MHVNNAIPLQPISPVPEMAIVIKDDATPPGPRKNAQPHPASAIQNRRPNWANRMAEGLQNGKAQLADGVAHTAKSLKENPKSPIYAATAGALLLLSSLAVFGNHHGTGHPHGRMLQVLGGGNQGAAGGVTQFDASPGDSDSGASNTGTYLVGGVVVAAILACAIACACRKQIKAKIESVNENWEIGREIEMFRREAANTET